jgi:hypothetical protein
VLYINCNYNVTCDYDCTATTGTLFMIHTTWPVRLDTAHAPSLSPAPVYCPDFAEERDVNWIIAPGLHGMWFNIGSRMRQYDVPHFVPLHIPHKCHPAIQGDLSATQRNDIQLYRVITVPRNGMSSSYTGWSQCHATECHPAIQGDLSATQRNDIQLYRVISVPRNRMSSSYTGWSKCHATECHPAIQGDLSAMQRNVIQLHRVISVPRNGMTSSYTGWSQCHATECSPVIQGDVNATQQTVCRMRVNHAIISPTSPKEPFSVCMRFIPIFNEYLCVILELWSVIRNDLRA